MVTQGWPPPLLGWPHNHRPPGLTFTGLYRQGPGGSRQSDWPEPEADREGPGPHAVHQRRDTRSPALLGYHSPGRPSHDMPGHGDPRLLHPEGARLALDLALNLEGGPSAKPSLAARATWDESPALFGPHFLCLKNEGMGLEGL